jgi:P-loop ATPase protein family
MSPNSVRPPPDPRLIIVSGMSGSGKSIALHTFEDLDFYCVDNLPAELLPEFVRGATGKSDLPPRLAVGIDVRSRNADLSNLPMLLSQAGALGMDPKLVFFDASDDVLLKRYAETRRRHPLSHLGLTLNEAIALERRMLKPLRAMADILIDTSDTNVHQMRRRVIAELDLTSERPVSLLFESFAYRRGVPADADFVFDARCLPNPLSGRTTGSGRVRRPGLRLSRHLDPTDPGRHAQLHHRRLRLHRRQTPLGVSGRNLRRTRPRSGLARGGDLSSRAGIARRSCRQPFGKRASAAFFGLRVHPGHCTQP